jgi:hypothetical protein
MVPLSLPLPLSPISNFPLLPPISAFRLLPHPRIQEVLERIQPRIPELTILTHPIRYLMQFFQPRFIISFAPLLLDHDQATFRQDFDMLIDRRPAHVEIAGHSIYI